jgi:predicted esterase
MMIQIGMRQHTSQSSACSLLFDRRRVAQPPPRNYPWRMRILFVLATLFALCTAQVSAQTFHAGNADDGMQDARNALRNLVHGSVFPGPRPNEHRIVWVWRPANAPANVALPTLYMFDGRDGLQIALLRLKPAFDSGALPPVLVIAVDPNPQNEGRGAEYLRGFPGGSDDFHVHEDWFVHQVVPWAQRTQHAATDPAKSFVGGFSNGADLSLVLANDHPDLFGGALVHSPVGAQSAWIVPNVAGHQRWVVTGGTAENSGSVHRPADVPRQIIETLQRLNAPVRACVGPWRHEGPAWRDLSPGSLVWLMGLGDPTAYATQQEQTYCRNSP